VIASSSCDNSPDTGGLEAIRTTPTARAFDLTTVANVAYKEQERSTRDGTQPATEPFDAENLMATIMHTLFDVGKLRLQDGLPQELRHVIDRGEPIPQLF